MITQRHMSGKFLQLHLSNVSCSDVWYEEEIQTQVLRTRGYCCLEYLTPFIRQIRYADWALIQWTEHVE